jgi:G3E family GTPase
MKGIVITGQYGNGKTTTINRIIPGILKEGKSLHTFVLESSPIAVDQDRYVGGSSSGASFASVCCPTFDDMQIALDTAVSRNQWDYLLMEPPGNMDPRFVVDAALQRDIEIEHVLMLTARDFFDTDKLMPTFDAGMQSSNVVGITRANKGGRPVQELEQIIRESQPGKQIVLVDDNFSWDVLKKVHPWSQFSYGLLEQPSFTLLKGEERTHSDHYFRTMKVIDPSLQRAQVEGLLEELANTGVTRAKGSVPKYGLSFDIQRGKLELHESAYKQGESGTLSVFSLEKLPTDVINRFSVNPSAVPSVIREGATIEEMQRVFAKLYDQSHKIEDLATKANGEVLYAFQPVDQALKVAREIFYKTKGESHQELRAILTPAIGVRFMALEELEDTQQPNRNYTGLMLTAYLAQKLAPEKGIDFPKLIDQAQLRRIREEAAPGLFRYASGLSRKEMPELVNYNIREGPYFLDVAKRALPYTQDSDSVSAAKNNMAGLNSNMGYGNLANGWRQLGNE